MLNIVIPQTAARVPRKPSYPQLYVQVFAAVTLSHRTRPPEAARRTAIRLGGSRAHRAAHGWVGWLGAAVIPQPPARILSDSTSPLNLP